MQRRQKAELSSLVLIQLLVSWYLGLHNPSMGVSHAPWCLQEMEETAALHLRST